MKRGMKNLIFGCALTSMFGTVACGDLEPPQSSASPQDIGVIELALQNVPPEVACVRITAKGTVRDKVVELPVVPGPSMTQVLTGFPLGKVTFGAESFAGTCESLSSKTIPNWVSDTIETSIVDGTKTRVEFNMHRNGRVDVSFNFPDEPLCSAAGVACKSSKDCCSNVCKTELCQAPPS
jgi:hypothetical protein